MRTRDIGGTRPPFFSIGVTSFNRPELLRVCLRSILAQTFGDFEVLVGNDDTANPLSPESLGISDPRIRIINHPTNLGERGNLNTLLGASAGTFFTWQADDDFYDPMFLEAIESALRSTPSPDAVFTDFLVLRGNAASGEAPRVSAIPASRTMPGESFVRMYLSGTIRAMGLVGVYPAEYLRKVGGVRDLVTAPIAVMSEYYLLLRCSKLRKIAYIDAPLVAYRAHDASWSGGGASSTLVEEAGLNLIKGAIEIFSAAPPSNDFQRDMKGVIRLVFRDVMKTVARDARPWTLLARGCGYVQRARLATADMLGRYGVATSPVSWYLILEFLKMLPQALFISASPLTIRRKAMRARGWFRGELYKPSLR